MTRRRRWLIIASLATALTLVAAACGDDDAETSTTTTTTQAPASTTTTTAATTTTTAAPATTTTTEAGMNVAFDVGVTEEPCPDSPNPDNGCIYLGVISDLSDGPFAPVARPLTQAQEDFWADVNANGGLDGFDVVITNDTTYDAHYTAEETVAGYQQIRGEIAALAQSLGTAQTAAALPDYVADNTVAAPATWWSAWGFPEVDHGLILEAGAPYCIEAMNGVDFLVDQLGGPFTYGIVGFPGDYGGDYGSGVKIAAAANGLDEPLFEVLQIPISFGGAVDEAVTQILAMQPQVVFMGVSANELGPIMGGVFANGGQAIFVGVGPSWNVGLLAVPDLVPILEQAFFLTGPWEPWAADTPGHARMRAAAEANGRSPNTGYTAGWVFQYNIKAVLEQAIANGDLTRDGGGILAAAGQLDSVDYEGMLPPKSFVGTPDETVERQTLVSKVSAEAPDGLVPATPFFTGPTARAYEMLAPCYTG